VLVVQSFPHFRQLPCIPYRARVDAPRSATTGIFRAELNGLGPEAAGIGNFAVSAIRTKPLLVA
jgi:hypothetical protein